MVDSAGTKCHALVPATLFRCNTVLSGAAEILECEKAHKPEFASDVAVRLLAERFLQSQGWPLQGT